MGSFKLNCLNIQYLVKYYLIYIIINYFLSLLVSNKKSMDQAMPDKIELVDDKILNNEEFKKNVAIPYFKDIFKDLAS